MDDGSLHSEGTSDTLPTKPNRQRSIVTNASAAKSLLDNLSKETEEKEPADFVQGPPLQPNRRQSVEFTASSAEATKLADAAPLRPGRQKTIPNFDPNKIAQALSDISLQSPTKAPSKNNSASLSTSVPRHRDNEVEYKSQTPVMPHRQASMTMSPSAINFDLLYTDSANAPQQSEPTPPARTATRQSSMADSSISASDASEQPPVRSYSIVSSISIDSSVAAAVAIAGGEDDDGTSIDTNDEANDPNNALAHVRRCHITGDVSPVRPNRRRSVEHDSSSNVNYGGKHGVPVRPNRRRSVEHDAAPGPPMKPNRRQSVEVASRSTVENAMVMNQQKAIEQKEDDGEEQLNDLVHRCSIAPLEGMGDSLVELQSFEDIDEDEED